MITEVKDNDIEMLAASFWLQVTGYKVQVTGCRFDS
jgi:hypothetical protein